MPNDPEERELTHNEGDEWSFRGHTFFIPDESEDRTSANEETVPLRPAHAFDRTRKRCGVCNDCCSRQPVWCESWGAPFDIALTPPAEGENGFGVDQETGERFPLIPARNPIIADDLLNNSASPGLASSRWIVPNREWRAEIKGRLDAADLAPFLQEWPVVLHKGVVIANNAPSQGSRVTFTYTYTPQMLPIWKRFLNRCSYLFGRVRYRVLHWS